MPLYEVGGYIATIGLSSVTEFINGPYGVLLTKFVNVYKCEFPFNIDSTMIHRVGLNVRGRSKIPSRVTGPFFEFDLPPPLRHPSSRSFSVHFVPASRSIFNFELPPYNSSFN